MKILIVEDREDCLFVLTKLLQIEGYSDVHAVRSGKLALTAMKETKFDVVICDYQLPEMKGDKVFELSRSEGHSCKFLLWTNADTTALPKFDDKGFLGVVQKSNIDDLFKKLLKAK